MSATMSKEIHETYMGLYKTHEQFEISQHILPVPVLLKISQHHADGEIFQNLYHHTCFIDEFFHADFLD
jgi:hypothetical protein